MWTMYKSRKTAMYVIYVGQVFMSMMYIYFKDKK